MNCVDCCFKFLWVFASVADAVVACLCVCVCVLSGALLCEVLMVYCRTSLMGQLWSFLQFLSGGFCGGMSLLLYVSYLDLFIFILFFLCLFFLFCVCLHVSCRVWARHEMLAMPYV